MKPEWWVCSCIKGITSIMFLWSTLASTRIINYSGIISALFFCPRHRHHYQWALFLALHLFKFNVSICISNTSIVYVWSKRNHHSTEQKQLKPRIKCRVLNMNAQRIHRTKKNKIKKTIRKILWLKWVMTFHLFID